jgi:hypothetical protein
MNYSANALEVDESSLSFCVNHLNAHPVSHVDTFETMHQFLFKGRMKKTDLPATCFPNISSSLARVQMAIFVPE